MTRVQVKAIGGTSAATKIRRFSCVLSPLVHPVYAAVELVCPGHGPRVLKVVPGEGEGPPLGHVGVDPLGACVYGGGRK